MGFCALGLGFMTKKKNNRKMGMGFQFELGFEKNNFLGNGISPPPLSRPSCKNKTAINSSNRAHENTELTESEVGAFERSNPCSITR